MQPTVPFLSCTCLMRDILLIIWGASVVQWVSLPTLIPHSRRRHANLSQ